MNEIVRINRIEISGNEVNSVNAREIWEYVESKKDFSNWVKSRLKDLGAVENEDYIRLAQKVEANNATKIEYIVTLDIAKHLAMMERNAKGREVRQYFIDYEKNTPIIPKKELTPMEMIAEMAQKLVEVERNEKRVIALEARANRLENNIRRTLKDTNHFTIIGYANLKGINLDGFHTGVLGRKATKLSKEQDYIVTSVPDAKYGKIGVYHKDIIEQVFRQIQQSA